MVPVGLYAYGIVSLDRVDRSRLFWKLNRQFSFAAPRVVGLPDLVVMAGLDEVDETVARRVLLGVGRGLLGLKNAHRRYVFETAISDAVIGYLANQFQLGEP